MLLPGLLRPACFPDDDSLEWKDRRVEAEARQGLLQGRVRVAGKGLRADTATAPAKKEAREVR